jgi:hypothetical protein
MANKTEHFYAGHISDFQLQDLLSWQIQGVWDVMLYGPVSFVVQTETWNSVAIWLFCVSD